MANKDASTAIVRRGTLGVFKRGFGTVSPGQTIHVRSASNQIRLQDSSNDYKYDLDVDASKFSIADMNVGVNRLTIDSAGKVGIGTTAPSSPLHVHKATGGTDIKLSAGNYGTNYGFLNLDSITLGLATGNGVRAISINHSNQYVAIGGELWYPKANLHVRGKTILDNATTAIGSAVPTTLYVNDQADATIGFGIRASGSNAQAIIGLDDSDSDNFKISYTTTDIGAVNHFTMNSSGKVGIGTTSPGSYKLYVNGSVKIGNNSMLSDATTSSVSLNSSSDVLLTAQQSSAVFAVKTWNGSTQATRFQISGAGAATTTTVNGALVVAHPGTAGTTAFQITNGNGVMATFYQNDYITMGGPSGNSLVCETNGNTTLTGALAGTTATFTSTTAAHPLTISGNSDNGDNSSALSIIDTDSTAGSKLPAIMFYGGSTLQGRIRGGDGTFGIAVGSTPTTALSIDTGTRATTFAGDAIVTGNLTVNGTTTTIDTTNLLIEDPLMLLARTQSGTPTLDSGLIIERGSSTNVGMIWDESGDEFAFINTTDTATTAGNVTIASYAPLQIGALTGTSATFSGGVDAQSRYIVQLTSNAGVSDVSYGSYVNGAWVNGKSGSNSYLSIAGTGVLKWNAAGIDVTGTGSFTGALTGTTAAFSGSDTTPQLKVSGGNAMLELDDTTSGSAFNIFSNGNCLRMARTGAGGYPASYFELNTTGQVGIGVASGTYQLNVGGSGNFSGALTGTSATFSGAVTPTTSYGSSLGSGSKYWNTLNTGVITVKGQSGDGLITLTNGGGTQSIRMDQNSIRTTTSNNITIFTSGNTNQLQLIQSNGSVNMSGALTVASGNSTGDFTVSGALTGTSATFSGTLTSSAGVANGTSYDRIVVDAQTGNYGGLWIKSDWNSGNQSRIGFYGTSASARGIGFITDNGTSPDVYINENGKVGIGTTAPGQKLEVNGNILINAQILTPGGSNLALNPNTGLVTVGGTLQASGAGTSSFAGPLTVSGDVTAYKAGSTKRFYVKNTDASKIGTFFADTAAVKITAEGSYPLLIHTPGTLTLNSGGSAALTLDGSQNATFSGTITENSSIALKENVFDLNTTLDKINRVRPVRYNKKVSKDKKEIGLIAEELAEIFPELVENDENGNPTSVNYTRAVTVLFDGFKQMYKELKEIKEKIK